MEESREGKRREEKKGENGRIASACSAGVAASQMEEWCLILVKLSPAPRGRLFSIFSWGAHCKTPSSAHSPLSVFVVDLEALIPSPQLGRKLSM